MTTIEISPEWFASRRSFTIRVRTNAPKTKLVEILPDGVVKMDVAKAPEDNKANVEIIRFFTKFLGTKVSMLMGKTSKEKVLKIVEG